MNTFFNINSDLERFLRLCIGGGEVEVNRFGSSDYYYALRSGVSSEIRKKHGIYFTGDDAARDLISQAKVEWREINKIYDPACGSGDLLVAAAEKLPIFNDLYETLSYWGDRIYGSDLHDELVRTTKLRLILLALERSPNSSSHRFDDLFSCLLNIKCENSLENDDAFSDCDLVVMNPPFNKVTEFSTDFCLSGHVNASVLFVEKAIKSLGEGRILAILPEVIRSGTRYAPVRNWVNQYVAGEVRSKGQFDRYTDVDVFVFEGGLNKGADKSDKPFSVESQSRAGSVSDFFYVRVGPVVPHRHPNAGKNVAYIHSRSIKPWSINKCIYERRLFSGTLYYPPFIVVRRTSSPSDRYRAVASLILGKRPVAVENHLIILLPKSGDVKLCYDALEVLKSEKVNDFLNNEIRCRHLTTSAVKKIPLNMEL